MMEKMRMFILLLLGIACFGGRINAQPLQKFSKMNIEEVTIFKDGHAFVQHRGKLPVNASGKVVMDYLPSPVLGTYWPYSADENAELRSVTSGRQKVLVEKTAVTIRELMEANLGAEVMIAEKPVYAESTSQPSLYRATILEIPTRSSEELEGSASSASMDQLSQKGNVVLLKTEQGVKVLEFNRILDVTFQSDRKKRLLEKEFRNLLTLDLKWQGQPKAEAEVGMIYLQKGIRWIPSYKISINDKNEAVLKLEATIINELADIEDVTANLVVGVPSFAFKDTVDPIALSQDVSRLSSNFARNSQTAYGFSNAIMSQQALPSGNVERSQRGAESTVDLGPTLSASQKNEDLFLFTVKHLSLKKGERMVLPIAEYQLSYQDVYALEIPFAPPLEVFQNFNHSRRKDMMTLHASPKVKHKIRIANKSEHPLTTAPALVMKEGRIVAQGMMTYTPVGQKVDIELTTAVNIGVKKIDHETKRTPNAVKWNNHGYSRVDLDGKIILTNYQEEPVTVEIVRYVLGNLDFVGQKGHREMVNLFEDYSFLPNSSKLSWWYQYSWPWWSYHFNRIGRVKWTTQLDPNQSSEHDYRWHYFWY